jgi:Zn-dependent protease
MIGAFFLELASQNPALFVCIVAAVIVSVTLHELGHVFAALSQGDDTPRVMGHVTWNPIVHMGPVSLVLLFVLGIAWGLTPVTPSRFRSRYGSAIVSFAGPAVNLLLAVLSLSLVGAWAKVSGGLPADLPPEYVAGTLHSQNLPMFFLFVLGAMNVVLFVLNLVPLPPLDGSAVVADLSPGYAEATRNPDFMPFFQAGIVLLFVLVDFFTPAFRLAGLWVTLFT